MKFLFFAILLFSMVIGGICSFLLGLTIFTEPQAPLEGISFLIITIILCSVASLLVFSKQRETAAFFPATSISSFLMAFMSTNQIVLLGPILLLFSIVTAYFIARKIGQTKKL